jgi:hypothetical protein
VINDDGDIDCQVWTFIYKHSKLANNILLSQVQNEVYYRVIQDVQNRSFSRLFSLIDSIREIN